MKIKIQDKKERTKTKIIKEYYVSCAICNRSIAGTSPNMADYNYRNHYESHFKKKEVKA